MFPAEGPGTGGGMELTTGLGCIRIETMTKIIISGDCIGLICLLFLRIRIYRQICGFSGRRRRL